jgi:hypothetical protein
MAIEYVKYCYLNKESWTSLRWWASKWNNLGFMTRSDFIFISKNIELVAYRYILFRNTTTISLNLQCHVRYCHDIEWGDYTWPGWQMIYRLRKIPSAVKAALIRGYFIRWCHNSLHTSNEKVVRDARYFLENDYSCNFHCNSHSRLKENIGCLDWRSH